MYTSGREWESGIGIGIATGVERGVGAARWGAPCERVEVKRRTKQVTTRSAAVAAAGLGGTDARGERECGACARGAGP